MKKRLITAYIVVGITAFTALLLLVRTTSLKKQVQTAKAETTKYKEKVLNYQQVVSVDSLVLKGNYNSAINQYNTILEEIGDTNHLLGVELRMAFAKKIQNFSSNYDSLEKSTVNKDTLLNLKPSSTIAVRQYDSINFALEKARIQVVRLKKQLQQRSFGEYLKFESKKGNQMHYVGQVKNHKANGIGIALLDTGSRYEGEWVDNERHGDGVFYWSDGQYYTGAYKNDKRNGLGTYHWPNGEKYVGFWKDDKRNGKGDFYDIDGNVVTSGFWKNDKLVEAEKKRKAK